MSWNPQYLFSIASTLSVLPALMLGLFLFRNLPVTLKGLTLLLGFGLMCDLFGWYAYLTNSEMANLIVFNCYVICEYSFYAWFAGQLLSGIRWSRYLKWAWVVLIPLWILTLGIDEKHRYFSLTSQILLSLLISYCLLHHIEKEEVPFSSAVFWILLGSFFYYFCTFFFVGFLNVKFILKIWHVKNIVGIISNTLFFFGFWVVARNPARKTA